jgi:hypothetical protein
MNRTIATGRQNHVAGQNLNPENVTAKAADCPDFFRIRRIPDVETTITAAADNSRAVCQEGRGVDRFAMSAECDHRIAGCGFKDFAGLVATAAHQTLPVGRPVNVHDPIRVIFNPYHFRTVSDFHDND